MHTTKQRTTNTKKIYQIVLNLNLKIMDAPQLTKVLHPYESIAS